MTFVMRDFQTPSIDLEGKSIFVTGGTGSFGKAFVTHLLKHHNVGKVVVFSRDEQKQFHMAQSLSLTEFPNLRYFIGDIRDPDRLELAMRDMDIVIHAAAMKHVPIAEYNPFECVRTNIYGAENIVKTALRCGVSKVIALSTDKACNPINLYGATKLASDKILIAANNLSGIGGPQFSVVRYGNVVGSQGSVLPFFNKLIKSGSDHLPITDKRMTRFWISLEQGIQFVLSSLALMRGGEIFIPKIPSMKMVDFANALAPGLEKRIIGIRPGEKLHETMISEDDARNTVELGDRFIIMPEQTDANLEYLKDLGAGPVDPDFRYASNSNIEWLNEQNLLQLIEDTNA